MTTLQRLPRQRGPSAFLHPFFSRLMPALAICLLGLSGCTSDQKNQATAEDQIDQDGASGDMEFGDSAADKQADKQADAQNDDLSADLAKEELEDPGTKQKSPAPTDAPVAAHQATAAPAAPENPVSAVEQKPAEKFTGNFSEVNVSDIRYVAKKGGGTVVVETSAPATYHTREVPAQSQVVMEIANATLPERLKRPYVTKDFGQSISSINAYQDKGSSTVRVVVQFRSPMHAEVNRDGRMLSLTAAEPISEIEDNPTLGMQNPYSEQPGDTSLEPGVSLSAAGEKPSAKQSEEKSAGTGGDDHDTRILPEMSTDRMASENIKFYGKPISIEVRDTPVRDVINLIADQSGANIVISGEVDGSISLKLRQVPWDQALLIVMRTRKLGYVRQGSILRIAPFESLQREAEAAKKVVDASKAAEPLRVRIIPVGYAKVEALEKQISAFLSPGRGKVVGDARTNALVVTDTPDVLERIANLVKALDLPPLQVLIEGKVIEARETFSRNFGVQWGFNGNTIDLGGGRGIDHSFATNMTVPSTGGVYNFRIGQFDVFGDISATIGLAEAEDQVKIVSSPRVVAVNNESATIVQGTSIPVLSTTVTTGATTTSVSYTPIEMKLDVTPQVTSENDVIMQINIKRDFAGQRSVGQAPDINRREAKTKVLVRNGQTAVVGGVYQSDSDDSEVGIPWLRNIPVLGWLFKNKAINSEKTELLVFLTPRILNAETSLQKENTL